MLTTSIYQNIIPLKTNNKAHWQTGLYYYGARYYNPRISTFISVDPLAEQTFEPYSYVGNNPIMFTDPTGMSKNGIYTDFVDVESGKITTIDDGIDQTIALDGASISIMQEIFNLDKEAYFDKLSELSNSGSNLGMNRSEFMFFAETLYAESSGGFEESLGIVNVLENRRSEEHTSELQSRGHLVCRLLLEKKNTSL